MPALPLTAGWSVVQLGYDEELGPLHGIYGSMEAEFKRAELCLVKTVIGPITVHADNKGIIHGLWRGERKCIDPKAGDADLWIKIWAELHLFTSKDMLVEVEHVRAHRTKKDKNDMSQFEKSVVEGNEKADVLGNTAAMLDEGFMAETRAKTVQQEREEKKCTRLCSTQPAFTAWCRNGKIVKSSSRSAKTMDFRG